MVGKRVKLDGRHGTITEVFDDGVTVAVEFDDRPGVVMVVGHEELTFLD